MIHLVKTKKRTKAVYYFGEWSRDCEDGFDENDVCTGEESNEGSWEAGVDGAEPGLIMPGTLLIGAKYFQEKRPRQLWIAAKLWKWDLK